MLNHDTDYLTLNLDMELETRNKTVLAKKNINNFEDRYVMLFIQVRRGKSRTLAKKRRKRRFS